VSPLREDRDPQVGSLAENVRDRKDDHSGRRGEARATRRGPRCGAWRPVAAATAGHRGARGPARGPDHRRGNRPRPAPPTGDNLHAGLGRGKDGERGGGSGRRWRWDPSSLNSGSRKRMGANGMYWVMGVIGDMVTETSMIFESGSAVRPERLGSPGAVLVWS
jgi:hypothetical protein